MLEPERYVCSSSDCPDATVFQEFLAAVAVMGR
jgi:hypothetical protein